MPLSLPPRARRPAAVAAAAAAVVAWLLTGGHGDDPASERERAVTSLTGISGTARQELGRMSLGEKVDQLFLVGFAGRDASAPIVATLRRRQLGGVLVAGRNWRDPAQGGELIAALRDAAAGGRAPPLIAAAQEGGNYRAFPQLPPAARQVDVGDTGSARRALRWAADTGRALRRLGIDLNLAPLADVAALDSPVADRAFGDDPAIVAAMTAAAIQGCRRAGILCAVGHFPGLGAASQDTALGPATVGLPLSDLLRRDVPVFQAAILERAPAIVLSNAVYAAYDGVTPAVLEPRVATDLLRGRLGFRGLAMTDDLGAGAITAERSVGQAAIAALQAGNDLLFIGRPGPEHDRARAAVLRAARRGELTAGRIDQAVARVLDLKRRAGLLAGH